MTTERKKNDVVRSVQDLLSLMQSDPQFAKEKAHIRIWFRGQGNAAWDLTPGVYRATFPAETEETRLNIERHLTQDFRLESAALLAHKADDADLYFLRQHYKMPTRLLDWTHSPIAALYFAAGTDEKSDGALFVMDAYMLSVTQEAQKSFQGIMTARNPIFKNSLRVIFDWWEVSKFPRFILPVRPENLDRRIVLQRGCFTFHPPGQDHLSETQNASLRKFVIPKEAKGTIKRELFLLGLNAFSVYGDFEGLSEKLKFAYKVGK